MFACPLQRVGRETVLGSHPIGFTIPQCDSAIVGNAKSRGRFHERIEHGLQIEGRATDDFQHVCGGCLLLHRLPAYPLDVGALLWHPNGWLLAGSRAGEGLAVWDATTGTQILTGMGSPAGLARDGGGRQLYYLSVAPDLYPKIITGLGEAGLSQENGGSGNTADGFNALQDNTSGSENTAVGTGALTFNTTANFNTAIGYEALTASTGAENTAGGVAAGSGRRRRSVRNT